MQVYLPVVEVKYSGRAREKWSQRQVAALLAAVVVVAAQVLLQAEVQLTSEGDADKRLDP